MHTTQRHGCRLPAFRIHRIPTKSFLCFGVLVGIVLNAPSSCADQIRVTIEPSGPAVTDQLPTFLLTFTPWSTYNNDRERMNLFLKPLEVAHGAGLVIESTQGPLAPLKPTPTDPQTRFPDQLERIELLVVPGGVEIPWRSHFQIETVWDFDRRLSNPDIYYVSYSHPTSWVGSQDAGRSVGVVSNTSVVAVVTSERLEALRQLRERDPELAGLSYQFRHFSRTHPSQNAYRLDPFVKLYAKSAVKIGAQRDEVLFMLGPPDQYFRWGKSRLRLGHHTDETWKYNLSPVGGAGIDFVDGKVVRISEGFDSPSWVCSAGATYDHVRFALGPPDQRRTWNEPQVGGYDELWLYKDGRRVRFLNRLVVEVKNPDEHTGRIDR